MLVRNLITGSSPSVLHRNGNPVNWRAHWPEVVADFFSESPPADDPCQDLTILTWNSRPAKSLLEQCLDWRGVPYLTLGRHLPAWRNCYKMYLNADVLGRVTTPYVMGLDADDVLVVASLHHLLRGFQSFGCDIVFGTEKQSWPDVKSLAKFELSIAQSAYCHLNSGTWIGKTEACRQFFQDCLDEDIGEILNAKRNMTMLYDDQGPTRKAFRRYHPRVLLDYHCQIFQSLFKVPISGEVLIQVQERSGSDSAVGADAHSAVAAAGLAHSAGRSGSLL